MRALPVQITDENKVNKVDLTALGAGVYALKVDASGSTSPVSGTVTAEQGTAAAVAGAWPVKLTDGTDTALVTAAGELNVLASAQPGVDIGDVTVNNAGGVAAVNVQDGGNSLTVDGTVTANAGTNLNTSLLALEAGGNLAAAATSLAIMDDWDESDRAKVNPIVGQAGVQGGAGVVTALTQRIVRSVEATYSASVAGLVTALVATDIFTITGSASKTVKITQIQVAATGNNNNVDLDLIKRSTANTGGTSTSRTAVPHDSTDAAATATVLAYTVNPTLGTPVGTVRATNFATSSAISPQADRVVFDFGASISKPIVLRGTSQVLAVNLNGNTIAAPAVDISVEWTEET